MAKSSISTKKAPAPVGAYPHARRAGKLLFLSGIGSREPGTNKIPATFEGQCHSVFKNVKTVLEASGAKWEDLIDVTVFLTNMKRDFETYNKIYAQYFKKDQPCRTTVGITALPTAIDIELKCIARINNKK